jgi:hypothetical protein
MRTYQRTVFAIVRGGFVLIPIFGLIILVANAFDHPLRRNEIGAAIFIIGVGIVGFFLTGVIRRIVLGD